MREGIRTSLLAIVCAVAVSGSAHAAASVRSVGGTGTYQSASSAATASVATPSSSASRAGSLRTTGGYIRPSATTSAASKATKAGSVATNGTTSRAASAPRLSIGKYVGAPKSVSQSGSGGSRDEQIENIERLIQQLETEKQTVLKDTRYITISDNGDVELSTDNLIADLQLHSGEDGRPVELNADNDTGIKWRYVAKAGEAEEEWRDLISWASVKEKIVTGDIAEINRSIETKVSDLESQIAIINSSISTLNTMMDTKVDLNQGTGNAGKVLTVDSTGHVTPGGVVYSTQDVDQLFDSVGDDLDKKLDKNQGAGNAGKVLAVGNDGDVITQDISSAIDVDLAGKVDKFQGVANEGKGLTVDSNGNVALTDVPLGSLAFQTTIDATNIPDRSITSQKLAEHAVTNTELATEISQAITDAAMLERFWAENAPGEDALLSIGPDGSPQWFLIAE